MLRIKALHLLSHMFFTGFTTLGLVALIDMSKWWIVTLLAAILFFIAFEIINRVDLDEQEVTLLALGAGCCIIVLCTFPCLATLFNIVIFLLMTGAYLLAVIFNYLGILIRLRKA